MEYTYINKYFKKMMKINIIDIKIMKTNIYI